MSYAPIPMVPGPVAPARRRHCRPRQGLRLGTGRIRLPVPLRRHQPRHRQLMGTKDDVVLMTGEGMLALWGALKSCLKPGDHVVSVGTGVFGDGIGEMAESFGCIVEKVSLPL